MKLNVSADAYVPQELARKFDADQLIGHFVLAKYEPQVGWPTRSIADWHLAAEPGVPVSTLLIDGIPGGWLLGRAIDAAGNIVNGEYALRLDTLESDIYALGGRFVAILPKHGRLYPDAGGLFSAMYCESLQAVASNPFLLPYTTETGYQVELLRDIRVPFKNAMFPLGATVRSNVRRVLPNHYLDLQSFELVRNWPLEPIAPLEDESPIVEEIIELIKRQLHATLRDGPSMLRLTAGKDSRMLLALARNNLEDAETVTMDYGEPKSAMDQAIASKLAKIAGVPHRKLHWTEPNKEDLDVWAFRTGLSVGAVRGWRGTTAWRLQVDPRRSDVLGTAGEVARGHWWNDDDTPATRITPSRLLSICSCPQHPSLVRLAEEWIRDVPADDVFQLLDLFYVEQRVGCWAGVWSFGMPFSRYQSFPIAHRRVLELMMRLPTRFRRQGQLAEEVIRREWPALLALPFNVPTTPQKLALKSQWLAGKIRKAARDPRWLYSKILRR